MIQVVDDDSWRGILIEAPQRSQKNSKGQASTFPVRQGTLVGLTQMEALLWTHGDVRPTNRMRPFFGAVRLRPEHWAMFTKRAMFTML